MKKQLTTILAITMLMIATIGLMAAEEAVAPVNPAELIQFRLIEAVQSNRAADAKAYAEALSAYRAAKALEVQTEVNAKANAWLEGYANILKTIPGFVRAYRQLHGGKDPEVDQALAAISFVLAAWDKPQDEASAKQLIQTLDGLDQLKAEARRKAEAEWRARK